MAKTSEILEKLRRIESLLSARPQSPPLSFEEAAKYLHLAKSTLYRLTSRSLIVHYKPSKKIFFLKSDLDEFLLRRRVSLRGEVE